jgi:hypothetical protein
MFPLNTILAWNINIIMNKKYDNNNIIIASRAYFLHSGAGVEYVASSLPCMLVSGAWQRVATTHGKALARQS